MKRLLYVFCFMAVLSAPAVSSAQSCDTIRVPWYENFSSSTVVHNIPSCWLAYRNSSYMPYITVGEKSLNCPMSTGDCYILSLPPVDLPPDSVFFSFQAKYSGQGVFQYGVMTDATDTNTLILIDTLPLISNSDWVTVSFSTIGLALSGNARLALKLTTTTYATVSFDNFYFDRAAGCDMPDMPRVTYVDTTMATLHWSCGSDFAGFVITLDDTLSSFAPDTLIDLVNLTPSHTYHYIIRTVCTDGDTTPVVSGVFSTLCPAQPLPWTANFNSNAQYDIPECWQVIEGLQYDAAGNPYPSVNLSHKLEFYSISDTNVMVLTPIFAHPGNALHIGFDMRLPVGDRMTIGVMNDPYDLLSYRQLVTYEGIELDLDDKHYEVYTEPVVDTDQVYVVFQWKAGGLNHRTTIDNVMVEVADSCHNPTDVVYSLVGQNTIMLEWTDYSIAAEGYEVRFSTVNDISATDTGWTTLSNWFVVDTLKVNTAYWFWVRSLCLGDSGAWIPAGMVRTICGQPTIPFFENFESYGESEGVSCWEYYHTDSTGHNPYVRSLTNTAHSGTKLWNFDNPYHDTVMVVLPSFGVNTLNLEVSFWGGVYYGLFEAGLYNMTTDEFTPVVTLSGTNYTLQQYTFQCDTVDAADAYSRIAFRWHKPAGVSWNTGVALLDDLRVRHIPYCYPPDSITAVGSTDTTMTLHIHDSRSNGNYRVLYYLDGDVPDTVMVVGEYVTLTGLQHSSYYTVEVSVVCFDGSVTDSIVGLFTTNCRRITHDILPYIETFDSYTSGNRINHCWYRGNYNPIIYGDYPMPYQGVFYGGGTSGVSMEFLVRSPLPKCQILTLPQVDYISDLYLEFYARVSNMHTRIDVGVMTDPENDSTFFAVSTMSPSVANSWLSYAAPLTGYAGSGRYIALRVYSETSLGFNSTAFIDNIALKIIPPCSDSLIGLAVSEVGSSCATVRWSESIGRNDDAVYVVHLTDTAGTEQYVDTTEYRIYTACGLDEKTSYRVYVELYCDSAAAAYSTDTIGFTTQCVESNTIRYGTLSGYTGNSSYLPVNTGCMMSEQIYRAYELESAPGDITDISFYLSTNAPLRDIIYGTIYLCHTADTIMRQWMPLENMEAVYEGPLNFNHGWSSISFAQPFHYNGTDNLMVAVKSTYDVFNSQFYFRITDSYDSASMYASSAGFIFSRQRNLVRFNICPDEISVCAPPTVTSISATDMTVTVAFAPTPCEIHLTQGWWNRGFSGQMDSTGSHTFTGLNPATQYTVGIRQHCANGERSLWTIRRITTQEVIALPPLVVEVDSVGIDRAKVTWQHRASETRWEVRLFNTYTDISVQLTDSAYIFSELLPRVTYNVSVRSMCGSDFSILSPWSDTVTFTTDYCHPVSNVTVSDITMHSAQVAWTPSDNGVAWKVEYGYQGFGHEDALGKLLVENATSVVIDSLEEGTSYSVFVSAVCGPGSSSGWVGVESFRTAGVSDIVALADGSGFVLYPNPATTMVTVRLDSYDPEARIDIIDQQGRTVATGTGSTATFDIGHLSAGVYYVRLSGSTYSSVKKLIVK